MGMSDDTGKYINGKTNTLGSKEKTITKTKIATVELGKTLLG